jgi:hypothetical protein
MMGSWPGLVQFGRAITRRNSKGKRLKSSMLRAVLTDGHFWAPAVVLVLATSLLLFLR